MPIPDNPTIKVVFTGLLVFGFDRNEPRAQIRIHNHEHHGLRIKVFRVRRATTNLILDLAPEDVTVENVTLNVLNAQMDGISLYQNGPFTREDDDDPHDFRWLVDLEGQEFHNRDLPPRMPTVLTKSFSMNNGLFYTAVRSPVRKKRGTDIEPTPIDVALKVAANIYLEDRAVLTYAAAGEPLSLMKETNTSYKIEVINNRVHPLGAAEHPSDFRFYYDAFDESPDERFDLLGIGGPNPDTRAHPCGPIGASKVPGD